MSQLLDFYISTSPFEQPSLPHEHSSSRDAPECTMTSLLASMHSGVQSGVGLRISNVRLDAQWTLKSDIGRREDAYG